MKSIWKFKLEVKDYQKITMPLNAQILSIQEQDNIPCIWSIVDTDTDNEYREFVMYSTGEPFPSVTETLKFIGTFQLFRGSFVAHLFEVIGNIHESPELNK